MDTATCPTHPHIETTTHHCHRCETQAHINIDTITEGLARYTDLLTPNQPGTLARLHRPTPTSTPTANLTTITAYDPRTPWPEPPNQHPYPITRAIWYTATTLATTHNLTQPTTTPHTIHILRNWLPTSPNHQLHDTTRQAANQTRRLTNPHRQPPPIGPCDQHTPDQQPCPGQYTQPDPETLHLTCNYCHHTKTPNDIWQTAITNQTAIPATDLTHFTGIPTRTLQHHAQHGKIRRNHGLYTIADTQTT